MDYFNIAFVLFRQFWFIPVFVVIVFFMRGNPKEIRGYLLYGNRSKKTVKLIDSGKGYLSEFRNYIFKVVILKRHYYFNESHIGYEDNLFSNLIPSMKRRYVFIDPLQLESMSLQDIELEDDNKIVGSTIKADCVLKPNGLGFQMLSAAAESNYFESEKSKLDTSTLLMVGFGGIGVGLVLRGILSAFGVSI